MPIVATAKSGSRELIPEGNHIATCIGMIQIGTVTSNIQGAMKSLHKVRITWEFPDEKRVYDETKGEQPMVFSKEFTLSLSDKSNLRKILESWRGAAFTAEEAAGFDITKLVGAPCMINIIHKASKTDPTKKYEEIGSIARLIKGMKKPDQVNPSRILSYDNFDFEYFDTLPDFIKEAMKSTPEYQELIARQNAKPVSHKVNVAVEDDDDNVDDLPF